MPAVNFSNLTPGMVIEKNLYSSNGVFLLPKDTVLTQHIIYYLTKWDLEHVNIVNEPKETIEDRKEKDQKKYDTYHLATEKIIKFMDGLKGCNKLKLDEVRNVVNEIMQFKDIHEALQVINKLKDEDHYTYQHCINVAIYTMFLGRWLALDTSSLKKLVYAALLHDIGKNRISPNIIMKPGKLTDDEFSEIKKHTIYGYNIVRYHTYFCHDITLGILQHHEKEDGSGYPFGIKKNKIHFYAKIIAVSDIFDAMTSKRVYKDRQSPFKTAELLLSSSYGQLDPFIVSTFIKKMADFYIGSSIVLNDGRVGRIVMKNPTEPTRPLIKIKDQFIDLSNEGDLYVQDILY
ncbi:HD-GYP domain-containing protein [Serpentinicella sp. ANB-PHB4]|uniref:HD-GYP domain-containing protein n=1 Tax=Serpentinicella sp. ANB-PHB4 TaxID=3074076 RepID=UPI0028633F3F|nr:HD-GYP domain-containing protein [Serpentinicella sp. ANB-PHB4]MDR5659697.1 HD-GYP domain-containing protein [Serpentinicella sp. ANB-PHB4]